MRQCNPAVKRARLAGRPSRCRPKPAPGSIPPRPAIPRTARPRPPATAPSWRRLRATGSRRRADRRRRCRTDRARVRAGRRAHRPRRPALRLRPAAWRRPAAAIPRAGRRVPPASPRARRAALQAHAPLPANRSSTRARQHGCQPVEQGFAHAVGAHRNPASSATGRRVPRQRPPMMRTEPDAGQFRLVKGAKPGNLCRSTAHTLSSQSHPVRAPAASTATKRTQLDIGVTTLDFVDKMHKRMRRITFIIGLDNSRTRPASTLRIAWKSPATVLGWPSQAFPPPSPYTRNEMTGMQYR